MMKNVFVGGTEEENCVACYNRNLFSTNFARIKEFLLKEKILLEEQTNDFYLKKIEINSAQYWLNFPITVSNTVILIAKEMNKKFSKKRLERFLLKQEKWMEENGYDY